MPIFLAYHIVIFGEIRTWSHYCVSSTTTRSLYAYWLFYKSAYPRSREYCLLPLSMLGEYGTDIIVEYIESDELHPNDIVPISQCLYN